MSLILEDPDNLLFHSLLKHFAGFISVQLHGINQDPSGFILALRSHWHHNTKEVAIKNSIGCYSWE